jgi:hypothetical protein
VTRAVARNQVARQTKAQVDWGVATILPNCIRLGFDRSQTHRKIGSSINCLLHSGNAMLGKRQL